MICQLEDSFNDNMTVTFVLCSSYSLVDVVLWCLYLRHILRVPDEPQDLIAGKRQGHKDKQSLERQTNMRNYSQ